MIQRDSNLVNSSPLQRSSRAGAVVEVHIYKPEGGVEWTLEVVNGRGTSTVRDDAFANDDAVYAAFLTAAKDDLP